MNPNVRLKRPRRRSYEMEIDSSDSDSEVDDSKGRLMPNGELRIPDYVQSVISELSAEDLELFHKTIENDGGTIEFSDDSSYDLSSDGSPELNVDQVLREFRDNNMRRGSRGPGRPKSSNTKAPRGRGSSTSRDATPSTSRESVPPTRPAKARRAQTEWKKDLKSATKHLRDINWISEGGMMLDMRPNNNNPKVKNWWDKEGVNFRAELIHKTFDENNVPEVKGFLAPNPLLQNKAEFMAKLRIHEASFKRLEEEHKQALAELRPREKEKEIEEDEDDDDDELEDADAPACDGVEVYEVERILLSKQSKRQKEARFLILWKGWTVEDLTWQAESDIFAPKKLKQYKNRLQICNKIKKRCDYRDKIYYPYHKNQQLYPARMQSFRKLVEWEYELNLVNKRFKVAPIYIENWVDDAREPIHFQYGQKNRITADAEAVFGEGSLVKQKCDCKPRCLPESCSCAKVEGTTLTYKNGLLNINYQHNRVVECGGLCGCGNDCPTRVIQRGRQFAVVLFRTAERGWSIRAAEKIRKDQFVMQYIGEVYLLCSSPKDVMYQYALDTCGHEDAIFCIDATHFGNEARWVNHSCAPNLNVVGVLASRYDNRYHELCFFAKRDIEAGEELLIDYGHKLNPCRCGAECCINPPGANENLLSEE
ncbi:unnamed protein product [Bursaphelenchus okinawaensis]|uniref:Histone-lysine N-methyltransferase n=1 Tax=Bursaphelenchus okinawaensis TaxID=465554 RepID=A0A811KTJ1_9BILA|nr:unnamed protein product [Bursaphelenchus okinawaensis]CAG9110057.1 unnamed protein product [Bursaphelenchus okinawaensis]